MKRWLSTVSALVLAVLVAVYLNYSGVSLAMILSYYVITFVLFLVLKWEIWKWFETRKTYFNIDLPRLRKVAKAKSLKMVNSWKNFKKIEKREEIEDPIERRAKQLKKLERGK